jgi:hypothetical protein
MLPPQREAADEAAIRGRSSTPAGPSPETPARRRTIPSRRTQAPNRALAEPGVSHRATAGARSWPPSAPGEPAFWPRAKTRFAEASSEAPARLRPFRGRSTAAPDVPSPPPPMQRRIGSVRDRGSQAACLEESLGHAVADDELFVVPRITHERPPLPAALRKKYRSFTVPRTGPSGAEPAINGPVVESEARSATRARSGSVRHDMASSTGGRLPMSS